MLSECNRSGRPRVEPIKEYFDEEVQIALGHARRLAKRIKALEGRVPRSPELSRVQKIYSRHPVDSTDVGSALIDAIKSEDAAIAQYERIIRLCDGHDFVTLDLAIELLVDERERRQRLAALLATEDQVGRAKADRAARSPSR